eukprot:1159809-Pelagomonas_calceolata.AAC.4
MAKYAIQWQVRLHDLRTSRLDETAESGAPAADVGAGTVRRLAAALVGFEGGHAAGQGWVKLKQARRQTNKQTNKQTGPRNPFSQAQRGSPTPKDLAQGCIPDPMSAHNPFPCC